MFQVALTFYAKGAPVRSRINRYSPEASLWLPLLVTVWSQSNNHMIVGAALLPACLARDNPWS